MMNWDEDDQDMAEREGWWISNDPDGREIIQRIDQADVGVQLEYDNDAWVMVWYGALGGHPLHVRALAYLYENSLNEFLAIAKHITGATDLRMEPVYAAVQNELLRDSGMLDEREEDP